MSTPEFRYALHDDISADEAQFVQRKLVEFADQFTEPRNYRQLGVVVRNEHGEPIGGITGNTVWDWLQIGVLWLSDEWRGRGIGHQLLERMESRGRDMGCRFARLDTFEFEAREFYEAHGYRVSSQTDDFPRGHTQFHLTKTL